MDTTEDSHQSVFFGAFDNYQSPPGSFSENTLEEKMKNLNVEDFNTFPGESLPEESEYPNFPLDISSVSKNNPSKTLDSLSYCKIE